MMPGKLQQFIYVAPVLVLCSRHHRGLTHRDTDINGLEDALDALEHVQWTRCTVIIMSRHASVAQTVPVY